LLLLESKTRGTTLPATGQSVLYPTWRNSLRK
jgi:hypothetical protein